MSEFPLQTPSYILSFQFSSWYPHSSAHSLKSTIIRPLSQQFCDYLHADRVFVPEGSEDLPAKSTLSDDEDVADEDEDEDEEPVRRFAFLELDAKIRACIKDYGAVFPKLNFSSPKDASWVLPASSPLKCTSPADVYLLLKSSDFVAHDLSPTTVFDGCGCSSDSDVPTPPYELELVLRKWYAVDKSRELRCFVRENLLLGISQRDTNYYPFLNEPATQQTIVTTITQFWATNIKQKWEATRDYTFDILLTRDLSRAHILDFNPYSPRTDPLLFTYQELHTLLQSHTRDPPDPPQLKTIDSRTHPAATTNAPVHQHNMVPFEALSLSSGKDIEEFADLWKEGIKDSMKDND